MNETEYRETEKLLENNCIESGTYGDCEKQCKYFKLCQRWGEEYRSRLNNGLEIEKRGRSYGKE